MNNIAKLLLIAKQKNNPDDCLLSKLPRELLKEIYFFLPIRSLGKIEHKKNDQFPKNAFIPLRNQERIDYKASANNTLFICYFYDKKKELLGYEMIFNQGSDALLHQTDEMIVMSVDEYNFLFN
jgi:hypothetical protein